MDHRLEEKSTIEVECRMEILLLASTGIGLGSRRERSPEKAHGLQEECHHEWCEMLVCPQKKILAGTARGAGT